MYGGAALARTYSLIKIVGTGKRSVAVHNPVNFCNSLKSAIPNINKPNIGIYGVSG
jgi:hypothetical protein